MVSNQLLMRQISLKSFYGFEDLKKTKSRPVLQREIIHMLWRGLVVAQSLSQKAKFRMAYRLLDGIVPSI